MMISWKDREWCSHSTCKFFDPDKCSRALTPDRVAEAEEWWAEFNLEGGAPIAVGVGVPSCYRPNGTIVKPKTKTTTTILELEEM